jgi:membrane protein DedA with SNARE-associated domain
MHLVKIAVACYPGGRFGYRETGDRSMRMLAYLLAIVCVIAAVVYFVMPAGQLPTFMPGYMAGSAHVHHAHAIAAAVAAVVLFLLGWFFGRSRRMA